MKFLEKLLRPGKRQGTSANDAAGHIAGALSAAGLGQNGPVGSVRATIDKAFADAGLVAMRVSTGHATRVDDPGRDANGSPTGADSASGGRGQFLHATYANAHGRRDYRLYLPQGYDIAGPARPLIVMLHGCTQSAEDFAVGTRMNALADRHGFLVAYPQQAGKANHAKCWNWFRPEDQRRDAGEPSVLAGIVQRIAQEHRVDPQRVFVAGLSAGAAMAVVLGRAYPELVRAIGVHSGLPYASAHDVPSAFAAMQRGGAASQDTGATVPMIIVHGDADRTVAPVNAERLAAAATRPGLVLKTETGRAQGGHAYTRQIATDDAGVPWLEHWTVHGAGHAWSGGDAAGTYTDPAGPDASAAMVDFFLRQATHRD